MSFEDNLVASLKCVKWLNNILSPEGGEGKSCDRSIAIEMYLISAPGQQIRTRGWDDEIVFKKRSNCFHISATDTNNKLYAIRKMGRFFFTALKFNNVTIIVRGLT